MQLTKFNNNMANATNAAAVAFEFKAPDNGAELHTDGCTLRLKFRLAAVGSTSDLGPATVRVLSGNLYVSVETRNDTGAYEWEQVSDTIITDLKPDKPFKPEAIEIPLGQHRFIRDNMMRIMIRAETTDAPLPLQIKNIDLRITDE